MSVWGLHMQVHTHTHTQDGWELFVGAVYVHGLTLVGHLWQPLTAANFPVLYGCSVSASSPSKHVLWRQKLKGKISGRRIASTSLKRSIHHTSYIHTSDAYTHTQVTQTEVTHTYFLWLMWCTTDSHQMIPFSLVSMHQLRHEYICTYHHLS